MDNWRVVRYRDGVFTEIDDTLVSEVRVSIRVNGREIVGLMAWPEALDYLAVGYLFARGRVSAPDAVKTVHTTLDSTRVEVVLSDN
ncbi:MAG TPA: formate dehydrogenase accessory sulfurtransferase FdhD, partial [bacterium]|nr:formate dehydrogenase accessory sulfurtransferase FdhD [bacterium]